MVPYAQVVTFCDQERKRKMCKKRGKSEEAACIEGEGRHEHDVQNLGEQTTGWTVARGACQLEPADTVQYMYGGRRRKRESEESRRLRGETECFQSSRIPSFPVRNRWPKPARRNGTRIATNVANVKVKRVRGWMFLCRLVLRGPGRASWVLKNIWCRMQCCRAEIFYFRLRLRLWP